MKKFYLLVFSFCLMISLRHEAATITTNYVTNTIIFSTGSTYITFAVKNNNPYSIILTDMTCLQADLYRDNEYELWYSTTSLSGAPTVTSPVWTLATSSIEQFNTNTYDYVTPFNCIGVTIAAGATVRFALKSNKGTCVAGGVTPNIFSSGGVDLLVGNNTTPGGLVGYFGWTGIGNSGTNYFFDGSITFEQTNAYNDIQVSKILFPSTVCNNATDNITARVCSKSTKSINMANNNINVNFNINGPNGPSTLTASSINGNLAPCGCIDLTVTSNLSAQGNYSVTASATLVGGNDINLTNNSKTDSIRNYKAVTNGDQTVCQFTNAANFGGFTSSGCVTSQSRKQIINCVVNVPINPDGSSDATASMFATGTLPQLPDGAQITGGKFWIQNLTSNSIAGNLSNEARFNIYGPAPNNQSNPFLPGLAGNPLNFGVYNFEYKLNLTPTILENMYAALGVGGTFNVGYWDILSNSAVADIQLNAQGFPTTCKIEIDYVINPIPKWYLSASGGSAFYNGTPFNPFFIPGSGITNTNNLTSVTYYAACSADTTCRVPVSISILPSPQVVQDSMSICEFPAGSYQGTFDLTSISSNVSNNNPNATVSYYQDIGLNVLCSPLNNFTTNGGIIYSKVSENNGCYSSDTVLLEVHLAPQFFNDPYDKTVCAPASIDAAQAIDIFSTSFPGTDTLYYEDAACTIIHPNPHTITTTDEVYIVLKTNTNPFCTDTTLANFTLTIPDGSIAAQDTTFDISVCSSVNINNYLIVDNSTNNLTTPSCQKVVGIQDISNGISLGLTSVEETIECATPVHNGQPYLKRHYQIEPTNQDSAEVCLYFLEDDLQAYNQDAPAYNFPTMDPYTNLVISKVDNGDILDPGHTVEVIPNSAITKSYDPVNTIWTICFPVQSFSYFYIHTFNPNNAALPVTLRSFTAVKEGDFSKIDWTITSVQGSAYFEIERSRDGKHFEIISDRIPVEDMAGATEKAYQYLDRIPFQGKNFYRLRITDMDQKVSLSNIAQVYFGALSLVNVYPNPAHNQLHIELALASKSNASIELVDLTGRVVHTMQADLTEGLNTLDMNLEPYSSGMYTLRISNGKGLLHTQKVRKD